MRNGIKQRYDYETFNVPVGKVYRLVCCDCNLTHDVVFLVEKNKLYMTAVKNKKMTKILRNA